MDGTPHTDEGHPLLRFERRLAHRVDKVWKALTDPTELTHWFPADVEMNFTLGGAMRFIFREGEGPTLDGEPIESSVDRWTELYEGWVKSFD